jgi:hypothetical protein
MHIAKIQVSGVVKGKFAGGPTFVTATANSKSEIG